MTEQEEREAQGGELKPCPFCGGKAKRGDYPTEPWIENAGASYIECTKCGASTALHFDRKENLISSWNDRASLAQAEGHLKDGAVSKGWKLVPASPTKTMIDAAYAAHDAYEASNGDAAWCGLYSAYRAMIAAATPSPVGVDAVQIVRGILAELRAEEDDPDRPVDSQRRAGWHAALNAFEEALSAAGITDTSEKGNG